MAAASELIGDQLAADPTLLTYPTLGLNLVFNFILTLVFIYRLREFEQCTAGRGMVVRDFRFAEPEAME